MRSILLCCALFACTDHPKVAQDSGLPADAVPFDGAMTATSLQLPIPPRSQWPNGDGYCGEMSIQSIALYNGAWISEQVARTVAGGELLLGDNATAALDALHLDHTDWDASAPQPQADEFLAWVKTQLQHGVPVIYAVYLTDGNNDPDYDHIVPAVGIDAMTLGGFVASDRLTMNTNFGDQLMIEMGSLRATRASCAVNSLHGGCVPTNVDYGVAVSGITDIQHTTLPATLTVQGDSEPNVSQGAPASQMMATVTVRGLVAGHTYTLLRYDDYTKVPTDATAAQFLASAFTHRTDFTASGDTWTFTDPTTFLSSGTMYYRAVPN
jgi:hypothetical protein